MDGETKSPSKTAKRKTSTVKKTASKKSAPKTAETSEFAKYIERIRASRKAADSLVGASGAARASVEILWEMVFDYLCSAESLSPSDFNTLAGVVQKLASARVAQTLDDSPASKSARAGESAFSPETLAKIEEQLKML